MSRIKIFLRMFTLSNAEREAVKIHIKDGMCLADALQHMCLLRIKVRLK